MAACLDRYQLPPVPGLENRFLHRGKSAWIYEPCVLRFNGYLGSDIASMKDNYTAVIKKADGFWFGWIEEVPGVNCQEPSKEELLESLRATLREALDFN